MTPEQKDYDKWNRFVSRMVDETAAGTRKWQAESHVEREDATGRIYSAKVLDKNVIVYPCRYRHWTDEEQFEWRDDVAIELITSLGDKLWRLPPVGLRFLLLQTIERQYAGADDLLREYLGE